MSRWRLYAATLIAVCLVSLSTGGAPARAQVPADAVAVYYVGPDDAIAAAIERAEPYLLRVDQLSLAQVVVVNNPPGRDPLAALSEGIQQERLGLVLFCGSFYPQDADDLRILLGLSTFGLDRTATAAPVRAGDATSGLPGAFNWRSAPEIQARTLITNPNLLQPIAVTPTRQGVIQQLRGRDQTQALVVGGWLAHPSNESWIEWAYFDYFVYRLVAEAAVAGRIVSFADYPQSPTPQQAGRLTILGGGAAVILLAGTLYYGARRRFYLYPELACRWEERTMLSGLAGPPLWHRVGFHRPLAGLLAFALPGLLLLIPAAAYYLTLLPDLLFPSHQGWGIWTAVVTATAGVLLLLDAGTGTAAVRCFSVYQRRAPQRAPRYLQFYVWWQFVSGALQVGLAAILIAFVLPVLGLAHIAYYLLARVLLQFPGFLGVFALTFRARQRFDHEQFLNLLYYLCMPLFQATLMVVLLSAQGAEPRRSLALVGLLGMAGGVALAEMVTFVVGAYLHRWEGYRLRAVLFPTFDRFVSAEVLAFGIPWALSASIPVIGFLLQSTVFSATLMPAGLEPWSWWLILGSTAGFEILLIGLYRGLMPALTEAAVLNARTLVRYYVSQAMRYGAWVSFFLLAALGALSTPALGRTLGLSDGSVDAWLPPLLAWGALRWTVWLPDRMLEAAGRPWIIALLALVEQILRIGGAVVLVERWGTQGLLVAYFVALLIRALLARTFARRYLAGARIYVWQTLLAPAGAALLLFSLLRNTGLAWLAITELQVVVLGAALLLPALLVYGFLTALFGGWDDAGVAELRMATQLSGLGYPLAWLLLQSVQLGARLSPLHGRFPVGIRDLAQEEARTLTFAKSPSEQIM